ncbi:hypothetical protein K9F62_00385 [Desulfovibrio sp. JY]|nr:hypothetical protein K9F62_00385 [Desulfovibrio sp. JY]
MSWTIRGLPRPEGEKAGTLLQNSGAFIKHNQRIRAFYSPHADEIHLPPKEPFVALEACYATALPEFGHWTGHVSRWAREFPGRYSDRGHPKSHSGEKTNWKATGHVLVEKQKSALRAEAKNRREQQEKTSKPNLPTLANAKGVAPGWYASSVAKNALSLRLLAWTKGESTQQEVE